MNVERDPVTRLLAAIEEPEPPRGLRGLTLAGAAAAGAREPAVDAWRRLWESRPLRLAWAVAVLVLVGANLALRAGSRARPPAVPAAAALQERAGLKELQAIVDLPRIRLHGTGIDGPEWRTTGPRTPEPKTPNHDTEDKS
ncbi:MAG: hypothetical protein B7X11_00200 [Acidobacteria bacterium 37-65-4]|nr:MAG: hypothetical protein B7Z68_01065 [Acidobacteria bacterium 21-70-11]OYW07228.1 MAG: hypothetical protein B7X11_00200 [Acidobacteria bacterium 37-65-4]HQT94129.1 hypothetical protein [Thermoanaerobaculaceae bacterium]HQU33416.1 hypothetical protein [Thermoanaerobaculaceae bacterium]